MNSKRLLAVLDRLTPSVRREVERALQRLQRRLTESQILDLLERGDSVVLGQAMRRLERDLQPALKTLAQAFVAGRVAATADVPASVRSAFRQMNPFALAAAERQAAKFVTGVSRETRMAIRTVVAEGFREGLPTREIAKLIRPAIGLTQRQARAVARAARLDESRGMASDRVRAKAEKYAQRLLKQRAVMIARTEVIASATAGQVQLWREAQGEGLLPPQAEKTWIVTDDDRLCNICAAFDGLTVPINSSFTVAEITVSGPPAHPQCRCAIGLDAGSLGIRRAA